MRDGVMIVTGASRGIGGAIAATLAANGRTVLAVSRSGSVPDVATGRVFGAACDVTDHHALRTLFSDASERLGPIRGIVNNAGIHRSGRSSTFEPAVFREVLETDVLAVFSCCREVHPHLVQGGGGVIVNIGSFFDRLGVPGHTAYCAAKAAVGALTRCLAVEWAPDQIRVVNVAPGYVRTALNEDFLNSSEGQKTMGRIPVGRAAEPAEIAGVVLQLLDHDYLTGETIYLDGGLGVVL